MSSYKVEKVAASCVLGEGPHWDDDQQALFYVDAFSSSICRLKDGRNTVCRVDESAMVSIIIPMKGKPDKFLVTIGDKVTEVTWDGVSATPQNIRVMCSVSGLGKEGTRFNDGKIGPEGRLWVGTIGKFDDGKLEEGAGVLFSITKNGVITKHLEGITIANGLAWTSDSKTFYYIDTATKRVDAFDFNPTSGEISNRRTAYDFSTDKDIPDFGGPDGMTIDTDGNLYVAVFGAGAVFNIDPRTQKLIRRISLPSPMTTSVAFGGRNRDELYVVSATFRLSEEQKDKFTDAGCVFKITGLGTRGDPMASAHCLI